MATTGLNRAKKRTSGVIGKLGRSVTFRSITADTSYSGGDFSNTSNDETVTAVFGNIQKNQFQDSTIKSGDRMATFSADSVSNEPKADDLIIDGSDTYRVVTVEVWDPGAETVAYACQLRLEA